MRHPHILKKDDTSLLIVDIQEKLAAAMDEDEKERVVKNVEKLIFVAEKLGIPVMVTEQYPKGLGRTLPELVESLGEFYKPIEKVDFSCCGAEALNERVREDGRRAVIVVGMETHVCILQTALDLLARGYQVHVPGDAVCSRHRYDWSVALERMRDEGAIITTTEAVIFELLERAGTPEFKEVLPVLK